MPPASSAPPAANLTARQTKFCHPTYSTMAPVWRQLFDVKEGIGGFLDGTYLVAHPREWADHTAQVPKVPTKKLVARRAIASYENVAATIIDAMKTALCREQPIRRMGDGTSGKETPIELWWDDVDGLGTHIDDFMANAWDLAATFGHVFLYMDREASPSEEQPATAADQRLPFLRLYTPLDAWDWIVDDTGVLTAIKFAELVPRQTIEQAWRPEVRVRLVDEERWTVYDQKGASVATGAHAMGRLPVVTLFAKRRPLEPQIGQSVLGDPKLYIDLYNLGSEVRELLRNQTFGVLNVPLGTGDAAMTLEDAKTMMTNASGTENILFSGTAADFISPSAENVTVYHQEIERKLRTIYRLCSLAWEADVRGVEAKGSLELKREDMNQRLSGYADELEHADYDIACLFYRATEGGDVGEQKLDAADMVIKYPDSFDMTPFDKIIEQAQAAMDLGMPAVFLKEMRKQLARKFDGMADLPEKQLAEIDRAIDAAPDDLTPAEQTHQRIQMTQEALKNTGKPNVPKVPKVSEAA